MSGKSSIFSRIRLVYRRSSTLTKCVVAAALVLCTIALLTLRLAITDVNSQNDAARNEAAQLEQENQELREDVSELGTVQSIVELAKKLLGLVDPDTVIFEPEQ